MNNAVLSVCSVFVLVLQTTEQRTKREQLKDKRQAIMKARLSKVRSRKTKKAKLDGTEDEDNEGVYPQLPHIKCSRLRIKSACMLQFKDHMNANEGLL